MSGINEVLSALFVQLPLYAEEGGERTSVKRQELVDRLIKQLDCSSEVAQTAVNCIERLFCTARLLHEDELQNGCWQFVSSPAALFGRSLLASLADPHQFLFDRSFWSHQDQASPLVDQQRKLLRTIELQRQQCHEVLAPPMRYVHVAWALIQVEGKVLFRAREDKKRPGLRNYVLVGGRMSQEDLRASGIENALAVLQSPSASDSRRALERTLEREIHEETGLLANKHYCSELVRSLKPYREVEGAGANHALTEYRIHVYGLELTRAGFLDLFDRTAEDPELTWFRLDEVVNGQTVDGRMAYINALIEDFPDHGAWQTFVQAIPQSVLPAYRFSQETDAVTMPAIDYATLVVGKTGKETQVSLALTQEERDLLLGLALCTKDAEAQIEANRMRRLAYGWFHVFDDALCQQMSQLAQKLSEAGYPLLEGADEHYFRLSLSPDLLFLPEALFRLCPGAPRTDRLELKRAAMSERFYRAQEKVIDISCGMSFRSAVDTLLAGSEVEDSNVDAVTKSLRRTVNPLSRELGLRSVMRTEKGRLKLAVDVKRDEQGEY